MVGYGLYEPIFDFDTSDMFKEKIKSIRSEQKDLIRNKKAVFCHTEWTVEGSKAKGRTMTNRSIRMTLRAFNGECDAIVAKVRWNNVDSCLNRIKRSKDALDKLNESNKITIGGDYNRLKRKELRAVHEYNENQALFVRPKKNLIDHDKLNEMIKSFRFVVD